MLCESFFEPSKRLFISYISRNGIPDFNKLVYLKLNLIVSVRQQLTFRGKDVVNNLKDYYYHRLSIPINEKKTTIEFNLRSFLRIHAKVKKYP